MFHHIYIEITNVCQFNCSFCPKTQRKATFLTPDQFRHIAKEARKHTKLIYLHVLGEPLIHPQLDEMLMIANEADLQVNITTNGFALPLAGPILLRHHHIKKINISLHSMEDDGQKRYDLSQYLKDVTAFAKQATIEIPATIVYRLWNTNLAYDTMIDFLQQVYAPEVPIRHHESPQNGVRLAYRVFYHQQNLFEWPSQTQSHVEEKLVLPSCAPAYCLGLKTHIAILSNGVVTPCCLDQEGSLSLGNIFDSPLSTILEGERAQAIKFGFQQRRAVEPLCQTCSYRNRFTSHDD